MLPMQLVQLICNLVHEPHNLLGCEGGTAVVGLHQLQIYQLPQISPTAPHYKCKPVQQPLIFQQLSSGHTPWQRCPGTVIELKMIPLLKEQEGTAFNILEETICFEYLQHMTYTMCTSFVDFRLPSLSNLLSHHQVIPLVKQTRN